MAEVLKGRSVKVGNARRQKCTCTKGQKCEVDKCRSPDVQQGINAKKAKVQKYKSARSGKVHKGRKTRLREYRRARMPKC